MSRPFALPKRLPPRLEQVHVYWRGLLRGSAQMPFWDDVKLSDLPDLRDDLFLLDVFERPERFRFAIVGKNLAGPRFDAAFLDELTPVTPFEFLRSQASAAVESASGTFWTNEGRQRLVLPLWGEGHISMLLGGVASA